MSGEQGTFIGQTFQPVAACHEVDVSSFVQVLFLVESPVGEVFLAAIAIDEGAVMTFLLIADTFAGMVADACTGPHVVHGPYDRFALGKDVFDIFQG